MVFDKADYTITVTVCVALLHELHFHYEFKKLSLYVQKKMALFLLNNNLLRYQISCIQNQYFPLTA